MPEHMEFIPYRFEVNLFAPGAKELLCRGHFSEVSGLEVTMEPRAIPQGGQNWGEVQRVGQTTFAPIVLKRGVTDLNHVWTWFDMTTRGANYGFRLNGTITVQTSKLNPDFDPAKPSGPDDGNDPLIVEPRMIFTLSNVLPTRFKGPDMSSVANQVAIEELTLVHESMTVDVPAKQGGQNG